MKYTHKELNRTWTINDDNTDIKTRYINDVIDMLAPKSVLLSLWFEEVKDTRHPWRYWKPEDNQHINYFYINDIWIIDDGAYNSEQYYNCWNAYLTEQLAQKELDKRKTIVKIMEYISDNFWIFEPDWNNEHQRKYIIYRNLYQKREITFDCLNKFYSPIWYFSCKEHAQDIIKKFDKELRLIYNI